MGKNKVYEQMEALDEFVSQGVIDGVLGVVKSGKEATVYCCEAGDRLVAAKVYRGREVRGFANDAVYRAGRNRRVTRVTRAMDNRSRFGQEASFAAWVNAEYATLELLHHAGADVPAPIAHSGAIILMEYIGDEDEPAPMLANVRLDRDEARTTFERVMRNIELTLSCDRVHGDLSAFNVLCWDGSVRVIDFPQAVDARFNPNAQQLLERDIERICAHFARAGVDADAARIARSMWGRYIRGGL